MEGHRAAIRARLLRSGHIKPGPDSVSWTINREAVTVAGWSRAILMQLAHPSIAAGVRDHSSFQRGLGTSLQRLHSTISAMLAIMFGTTEQMIDAAARINTIHDRINGRVYDASPESYSAHDPELLRWVHVTLVDSILGTYERLIAPLSGVERDRYCAETTIMESLLGLPDGWLPRDRAQIDACLGQMIAAGKLTVTAHSRRLARAVLYPPYWRLAWPAFRPMQLMTIGSLPGPIRDAYGFEWRDADARALSRWTKMLRTTLRVTPAFARQWPMGRRRVRDRQIAAVELSPRELISRVD